jgi:hypothetical protein
MCTPGLYIFITLASSNKILVHIGAFRILFSQGKANVNQMWGLMVLLVSKLAGYSTNVTWKESDFDRDTGILKSQRILAEAVEITSSANEIHRDGVLNMQHCRMAGMNLDNDNLQVFGNKVSTLPFFPQQHLIILLPFFCMLTVLFRWPFSVEISCLATHRLKFQN